MTIRLALIGLGGWAAVLYQFLTQVGDVQVVAAHDSDAGAARQFGEIFGVPVAATLDEILENPEIDGAVVVTSNETHAPVALRCLLAGKDVLVEKPITLSLPDAEDLIMTAAAAGRILMVGHNTRRSPAMRQLKALLEEGRIGQVATIAAAYSYLNLDAATTNTWRNDPLRCPGGPLLQLGVHHADNLLYLAGPVEQVYGELLAPRPGARVPVGGHLVLRFAGGILGTITSDYCTGPESFTITVRGDRGQLELLGEDRLRLTDLSGDASELHPAGAYSLQAELEEFVACIRTRRQPETDGGVGRDALAVILAGLRSAAEGAPVRLT